MYEEKRVNPCRYRTSFGVEGEGSSGDLRTPPKKTLNPYQILYKCHLLPKSNKSKNKNVFSKQYQLYNIKNIIGKSLF